jgi:hypothetical protein
MKAINRIGETNINKFGSEMKIINMVNCDNITVEFSNGYITNAQYTQFAKGILISPYDKTICDIGYLESFTDIDIKIYNIWKKMIERCYCEKTIKKHPTYRGCLVCDEWHSYKIFREWYIKNYYEINNEAMEIDKDILHKGNKIYSPENCVLVPSSINCLFTKSNSARGNCVIRVYFKKENNKYVSQCSKTVGNKRKNIFLGYYYSEYEAFLAYKNFKENLIKETAFKFQGKIPYKLYEAMINYNVDITD